MHVVNHDEQPPGGTRRGGRARADVGIPAVTPASARAGPAGQGQQRLGGPAGGMGT